VRSDKLRRIAIVDVNPKAPLRRLKRLFDQRSKLTTVSVTQFDVPKDGSAPSWHVDASAATS
jgi:hypothetical protein